MKRESLYSLGIKAQNGDEIALIKIIDRKKYLINQCANGDEDCYQYILEKIIKNIKNYDFEKNF